MFKMPINPNDLFDQGYVVNELESFISKRLLKLVEDDEYQFESHPEGQDGRYEKQFANRYTAIWDLSGSGVPRGYLRIADEMRASLDPLMRVCLGGREYEGTYCGVHRIESGYNMDFHQDYASDAPLIALCYVSSDALTEADGGLFKVRKKIWGDMREEISYRITGEIIPKHGTVILINNTSPLFEHGVETFLAEDKKRYLVSFSFNTSEDW